MTQLSEMFSWEAYHGPNVTAYRADDQRPLLDLLRRHWPEARSLVDFGCGHGHFIRAARSAGWDARGIEIDPDTRARTASFSGCDVTDLEQATGADVVAALNSLVAVPRPSEVVRRLNGSRLVIDMAVEENPRGALLARIPAWFRRRAAEGTPTILWRASAAGIDRWLAALGYRRVYRRVTDSGWPYILGATAARRAVGRFSIATSAVVPSFGDRLVALYEKR
jgi:trans-aconitate methyltransferase